MTLFFMKGAENMAKFFKKLYVFLLIGIMCTNMLNVQAFAKETLESGNIWYGDEVSVDVTVGTEGYTYMTCFQTPRHAYEISNHAVNNAIPQTFVLVDTVAYDGKTWTPDGLYVSGQSNYEVVYCCDIDTGIENGVYYKRMNLEDSEYYSAKTAARIRAIITNSYPYVSLEEMISNLAADDFPNADKLTRADIIAAVQAAVWTCANDTTVQYLKSHDFAANPRWGGVMHDYSAEMGKFADIPTGKFIVDEEVGARVNNLIDYLLAQDEVYANKKQVVITDLQMVGSPVLTDKDTQTYKIKLTVTLNNSGSGYDDNINITVTAGDSEMNKVELPVVYGTEKYSFELDVKRGDEIKAVVSGTQVLPKGVYFYAPKPADVNGDGIATGREVSQNLVGVSMGETPVYFEETLSSTPQIPVTTPTPGPTDEPTDEPSNTPIPTISPTPVITDDDEIPGGSANIPTPTPIPEVKPTTSPTPTATPKPIPSVVPPEITLDDDPIPGAPAKLPKTGGIPPLVYYGLGGIMLGVGLLWRKKK